MARLYHYVGPEEVRRKAAGAPPGLPVLLAGDLEGWLRTAGQRPNREGLLAVTFIVDRQGDLRVADRRSEHVACAAGGPVLSAGEMFFRLTGAGPEVAEVSNQSTGYCPEPASWPAVAAALDRLGLPHPGRFTQEVTFRRCAACGQRNVVRDGWLACGVCGADLPADWNFDEGEGHGQ
jgi:hypothetical protein